MQADRTCQKRMEELASRAARTGITQLTSFLTPSQLVQADISARQEGVCIQAWGGVLDAERRIAAFCGSMDDEPQWPIALIAFEWNAKFGALSHRDLLGSLMALGIDREKFGDLFIAEDKAYAVVHEHIADYVLGSIDRVGKVPVCAKTLLETPPLLASQGESVYCTVASLRLDALLCAVWKLSRSAAQSLIASGKVQVDYRLALHPDCFMKENMIVSLRGRGRCKLIEIVGKTKKDRISVMLMRF